MSQQQIDFTPKIANMDAPELPMSAIDQTSSRIHSSAHAQIFIWLSTGIAKQNY